MAREGFKPCSIISCHLKYRAEHDLWRPWFLISQHSKETHNYYCQIVYFTIYIFWNITIYNITWHKGYKRNTVGRSPRMVWKCVKHSKKGTFDPWDVEKKLNYWAMANQLPLPGGASTSEVSITFKIPWSLHRLPPWVYSLNRGGIGPLLFPGPPLAAGTCARWLWRSRV